MRRRKRHAPVSGPSNDSYETPVEPVSPAIAARNRPYTPAGEPADEGAAVDAATNLASVSDAELEQLEKALEDAP